MGTLVRSFVLVLAFACLFPRPAAAQILYSWGENDFGQLGNGNTTNSNVPIAVTTSGALNGLTVQQFAGGGAHSLALASNGRIYSWGRNTEGQLGNGNNTASNVPVAVSSSGVLNGVTVTRITGGRFHNLALGSNGNVYSWGFNSNGSLGNGSTLSTNTPVAVTMSGVLAGLSVTQIAAGNGSSLALASNGRVYSWGSNNSGQLGNSGSADSTTPVAVTTSGVLNNVTISQVASGGFHNLALSTSGRVYAWGLNVSGQLGNGSSGGEFNIPVAVDPNGVLDNLRVMQIAGGGNHSLALANDGRVYSWGQNSAGQLGNTNVTSSNVPVAITSSLLNGLSVTQIAASQENSYALTSTGRLFAWGDNEFGQLGQGTFGGTSNVPVEIFAPSGFFFTAISADANGTQVLATLTPVPEPAFVLGLVATGLFVTIRLRSLFFSV